MTCTHRLGHYSSYSLSQLVGDVPTRVEVYCGHCKAHVPATLDWFKRANERGLIDNPEMVRNIITAKARVDSITTFSEKDGVPASWHDAIDEWSANNGPMPADVQRRLNARVLAKKRSATTAPPLAA